MNALSTEQAAALSGLQGQIVRRYCRLGILPAQRLGETYYIIQTEDLVRFLVDHKTGKFDGRRRENKSK